MTLSSLGLDEVGGSGKGREGESLVLQGGYVEEDWLEQKHHSSTAAHDAGLVRQIYNVLLTPPVPSCSTLFILLHLICKPNQSIESILKSFRTKTIYIYISTPYNNNNNNTYTQHVLPKRLVFASQGQHLHSSCKSRPIPSDMIAPCRSPIPPPPPPPPSSPSSSSRRLTECRVYGIEYSPQEPSSRTS